MTGWCTIGPGQPPNHSRRLPSLCRWYCGGLLFAAHAGAVLAVTSPMTIDATTVVVVDDDPCLRELMARCLEQRGCLVIVAQDGREALRIIERYPDPIDLLISDVIMPHVGGFALVAQVSQERPAMKILYVSAHAESSPEVRMGLQAAGRLYLKKPFQHDEFLKVIDQALNLTAGGAADAVSLVVSHPALRAQAVPTWRPAGGQPRSGLRYRVDTPVQFRLSDNRYVGGRGTPRLEPLGPALRYDANTRGPRPAPCPSARRCSSAAAPPARPRHQRRVPWRAGPYDAPRGARAPPGTRDRGCKLWRRYAAQSSVSTDSCDYPGRANLPNKRPYRKPAASGIPSGLGWTAFSHI